MSRRSANIYVIPGGPESQWHQLPADALARQKSLAGWDVRLFLSPGEFSRVFKLRFSTEEFKGPEGVVSHLVSRLEQAGVLYRETGRFSLCPTCGGTAGKPGPCLRCGSDVVEGDALWQMRLGPLPEALPPLANQIHPPHRREPVLADISRLLPGGVPAALESSQGTILPGDWLGALAAVLAGCGYPGDEGGQKLLAATYIFLPPEKSSYILYWTHLLKALRLPEPGGFICHGPFRVLDRRQQEVSPLLLAQNYGQESIRYFLLAVNTAPGENTYTEEKVIQRINHDLANDLGNLVARIITLVSQYAGEMVPRPNLLTRQSADLELRERALETPTRIEEHVSSHQAFLAIRVLKNLIGATDRYILSAAPQRMGQEEEGQERLNTVVYSICEALRFIAVSLKSIIPDTAETILSQLGLENASSLGAWSSLAQWGLLPENTKVNPGALLFPRIYSGYGGVGKDLLPREELSRFNMVVARVLSAEAVKEYEGLLHLILYDGRQRYSVLAPVGRSGPADALEGKKVVLFSNLRPRHIEGLLSEGEVLVLETETGSPRVVLVDSDIPEGSKVLCLS